MKRRRSPCFLCAVALGAVAALSQTPLWAQEKAREKSHDALAQARGKARAQNQRVLLLLTAGKSAVGDALTAACSNYRVMGKLLKYEYQVVALPVSSLPGRAIKERLRLGMLAFPALAVLNAKDEVLGTLSAEQMVADAVFSADRVRGFLEKHKCAPVDARKVLAAGIAAAKKSKRHAFVYLSAPW